MLWTHSCFPLGLEGNFGVLHVPNLLVGDVYRVKKEGYSREVFMMRYFNRTLSMYTYVYVKKKILKSQKYLKILLIILSFLLKNWEAPRWFEIRSSDCVTRWEAGKEKNVIKFNLQGGTKC